MAIKKIESKTLLIMALVPAGLIFAYFLFFSDNSEVRESAYANSNGVPIPDSKGDEVEKSKVVAYQKEKEQINREKGEREQSTISADDFLNQAVTDEPEVKEIKETPTRDVNTVQKREANTEVRTVYVERKREVRVNTDSIYEAERLAREEKKKNEAGGFGIVMANENGSNSGLSKNSKPEAESKEFFSIMLEEDIKVKNKSSVVFYLIEDCVLGGMTVEKNSILFGKAYEQGGVFDIKIERIQLRSGKMIAINDVYVYDEKFSRGLPCEGSLNQAVKEGTNQTTSNASNGLAGSGTGGLGLAVNALGNTVNSLTRKQENSVDLYKGYKLYIKKD